MRVDYDKNRFTYTQADIDEWMERLAIRNKECEQLERERDEAILQRNETNESSVFSCNFYYEEKLKAERERDEAREQVNRYRYNLDLLPIKWDI